MIDVFWFKGRPMSRAHLFDLRYEHEMRSVPAPAATPSQLPLPGHGLVARLRALKAQMDAERGTLAAWMVAPHTVFS